MFPLSDPTPMLDFSECDDGFRPLLADIDHGVLHSTQNTVYGLWPDLTLAYMNPAWFVFAYENGGGEAVAKRWRIGRSVLDAAPKVVRPFYENHLRRVLSEDRPWEHRYECSSDEVFREYHLTVYPLGKGQGLLLVNSLAVESRQDRESASPIETLYRDHRGFLRQCCHCRRFRRIDLPNTWEWISTWVKQSPPAVSHVICETCAGYYYCDSRQDDDHPGPISTIAG